MEASSPSRESLEFDDPHAANMLFGPHNAHLDILAAASGARLATCGAGLYIDTPDQAVRRRLCNLFLQLYELARGGMDISGQDVSRAYAMLTADPGVNLRQIYKEAVFVATPRKTVTARNLAQKTYLGLLRSHEMVFAVGPAGTGKTYLAVAMALNMLQQHKVKRIVLTRPAVEAGERLGFLPGDLAEKVNPYLRPLFDGLLAMFGPEDFLHLQQKGAIEVAPLAYMRGRTLEKSFVILDEAQNTTVEQIKMFLTRLGFRSKMVVNGDVTQIDLPPHVRCGLTDAVRVLRGVPDIAQVRFGEEDVVRHDLVAATIHAYEEDGKRRKHREEADHGDHD